ncbi:MAG: DUF4296 domain-containing protein [Bacteroidales bacterium]|nr:DUF4296 domain-containing protein [Bacteroidales bacterium]
MRNGLWLVLTAVVCSCVLGCSRNSSSSEEVLGSAAMEAVLYDYQRLLGLAEQQSFDNPTRQACKQYIFKKHHITEAQFDTSMVYYTRNTIKLAEIYTRLRKRFEAEYDNINRITGGDEQSTHTSPEGDSVDLWWFNSYYLLSNSPLNTNFSFILEADSNYHPTDSFVFSARFMPLNNVDSFSLVMGLRSEYTQNENRYQTKHISHAGTDSLCIYLANAKRLQNLTGFVCLTTPPIPVGRSIEPYSSPLILVHQIKLMRYHTTSLDSLSKADTITSNSTDSTSFDMPSATPVLPLEMEEIIENESNQPQRMTPDEFRNKSKKPSQVRPLNRLDNSKRTLRSNQRIPSTPRN